MLQTDDQVNALGHSFRHSLAPLIDGHFILRRQIVHHCVAVEHPGQCRHVIRGQIHGVSGKVSVQIQLAVSIHAANPENLKPRAAHRKKLYPLYTLVVLLAALIYWLLPNDHLILYHKWMLILVAAVTFLLISNTFDGVVREKDGQFLSRKRENSPGIGLESIRSICDKYDAIMDIRYDSRTFLLLLVLPTREKPQ